MPIINDKTAFFFKKSNVQFIVQIWYIASKEVHPIKWGNDLIYSWNVIEGLL